METKATQNLRDSILQKKARIAEIDRNLGKYPLEIQRSEKGEIKAYPTRPPTRLEEERQRLLIAVAVLEREEEERKRVSQVHRITQSPSPVTRFRGSWIRPAPERTQVPSGLPPHYPNDLIPQTHLIIAEAVRKFPDQTHTLELCRYVISELGQHFRAAVQERTLRADLVFPNMIELVHYILVSNRESDDNRFRLEQEVRKSDEWLKLAREVVNVRCGSSESKNPVSKARLKATVNSPIAARRMEDFLESRGIGQTDFASSINTTDRTLRAFRKTGRVRRDIFDAIAKKMSITKEELLKPE